MEEFKDIPDYEWIYAISEYGVIRSHDRVVSHGYTKKQTLKGKILRYQIDKDGYPCLRLSKNGKKKYFHIHTLVAKTWIPNPLNLPQVNHIDGVKTNTHKSNLEWCTSSDNAKHAYKLGLRTSAWLGNGSMTGKFGADHNQSKPVIQLTMDGKEVRRFDCMVDAKKFGFQPTHIGACCMGKVRHHRNFKWEYA